MRTLHLFRAFLITLAGWAERRIAAARGVRWTIRRRVEPAVDVDPALRPLAALLIAEQEEIRRGVELSVQALSRQFDETVRARGLVLGSSEVAVVLIEARRCPAGFEAPPTAIDLQEILEWSTSE